MHDAGQIALPLSMRKGGSAARIVVGDANARAVEALQASADWPYRTAILAGPPRSGKTMLANWFAAREMGDVVDDAHMQDETQLFHRWNRAQEAGRALLLTVPAGGWDIALPDLKSRLGAALHLEIGAPGDDMVPALLEEHAAQAGLALGEGAITYLAPRVERSFAGIEKIVGAIDRLTLERKVPATLSIWRDALAAVMGAEQPRLF